MANNTTLPRFDHFPTDLPTTNRPQNDGSSINDDTSRLDGVAKVTGKAKYGRDQYLKNSLFVGFLRCPFGVAELQSIDREAPLSVNGVKEIVVLSEAGEYHGQPIAYVVADSKTALRRGLRAAKPTWRQGDATHKLQAAVGKPPEMDDEHRALVRTGDQMIEAIYDTEIQTHSSLETHGVVIDHRGNDATVYASTQGTFAVAGQVGRPLELEQGNYEVVCEYVGGGFGSKFQIGTEGRVAAEVAARYKQPVSCFVDRDGEHLDTGCRPSSRSVARIAFRNDGTILGGQIHTFGGVGVARRGGGVRFPSGRYDWGDIQRDHEDVSFNAGGPRAMRAPGHPQGAFAEELLIDEIATSCNIDPLELRLKMDFDDDRRTMYREGAEMIGWSDRPKAGAQATTIRRGMGMGSTSWFNGKARSEAEVVVHRDGSVEVRTGTQDIGTGQRTVMGALVAEHLSVPFELVNVKIGRSTLPYGPASGGSTTARATSPAMIAAALDAKNRVLEAVASFVDKAPNQIDIRDGRIVDDSGAPLMTWAEACRRLPAAAITGRGDFDRNSNDHWGEGHSGGAQFVDLRVDVETGVVHVDRVVAIQSCGRAISRKTVESQIIGGVIQGVSFALFENKWMDRNTAAMVNPNLEWYKILGPDDMPHIEPVIWRRGQTGVRSLGEPPVIPTAGAVACAIFNAIGAPVRSLPMTPGKVLAAIDTGWTGVNKVGAGAGEGGGA